MRLEQALRACLSAKTDTDATTAWAIVEQEAFGMSASELKSIYLKVRTEFLS